MLCKNLTIERPPNACDRKLHKSVLRMMTWDNIANKALSFFTHLLWWDSYNPSLPLDRTLDGR